MRKLIVLFILAALLLSSCSTPAPAPETIKITWWSEVATEIQYPHHSVGDFEQGELGDIIVGMWHEAYPEFDNVEVEVLPAGYAGGDRDPLVDAMIAAGQPPDLIDGYAGRYTSFLDAAIDLDPYLSQEQKDSLYYYEPGLNYMALVGTVEYGLVNATVLKSVGIEPPEAWSWVSKEEFVSWAEPLKEAGLWLACIHGAGRSSQQWNWAWFGNAGLQVWEDGYTGIALNSPEGVAVMEELVGWQEAGYIVPGAAALTDGDCAAQYWALNKTAYFQGGRLAFLSMHDAAVESGDIPERPELVPVFGIGADGGNVETQQFTNIQFVTMFAAEEARAPAVSLAMFMNSGPYVSELMSAVPNASYQIEKCGNTEYGEAAVIEYAKDHNMDSGTFTPLYNATRLTFSEYFGAALRGDMTPAEALAGFEADVEALIAQ